MLDCCQSSRLAVRAAPLYVYVRLAFPLFSRLSVSLPFFLGHACVPLRTRLVVSVVSVLFGFDYAAVTLRKKNNDMYIYIYSFT